MKTIFIFFTFIIVGCYKVENNKVHLKGYQNSSLFFLNYHNLTLNNWVNYYKNLDPGFSLNKFKLTSKNKRSITKGHIFGIFDKKFDHIYSNFLVYNKKKDKYLDFDSYQWNLDNNKINFEVDQEIDLVNIPKKTIERIEFSGSTSWVENAYCQNDHVIILLKNSQDRKPIISEINLMTNENKNFTYQDTLKFASDYSKQRIKRILKNPSFK